MLPEKYRKETIPPLSFNVRNKAKTGIANKLALLIKELSLPDSYDLREHIEVEVKDQMQTGECWAFSASSAVETTLAVENNEYYNFSERHMEYNTSSSFYDGQLNEWALNREAIIQEVQDQYWKKKCLLKIMKIQLI